MRPDEDDFASVIVAGQFQLIDDTGRVVMDLDAPDAPLGATLNMLHDEPTVVDSYLGWSVNPLPAPGQAKVELQGPTPTADPAGSYGPRLSLDANYAGTGLNRLAVEAGFRGAAANGATIAVTSPAAPGAAQLSATVPNASMVATGTAAPAAGTLLLEGFTQLRARQGGSDIDMTAGDINLAPTDRVQIGARDAFLPITESYDLQHTPAQLVTTVRTVLGGLSQAVNLVAGDAVWLFLTVPVRRRLVVGPVTERCRFYLYVNGALHRQTAVCYPTIETSAVAHLEGAYTVPATGAYTFDARVDCSATNNDYTTEAPGGSLLIQSWGIR